ncbi:MAG TPA: OmpA family protein [Syntrophobacteraceae bacterium]|nr:OmpA family protein [Syntrophobacteraceae bacterium]
MNKKVLILCIALAFVVSGCSTPMTNTEKGTAAGVGIGAATGAILGQAIGRNTSSTLLGAAAGAAVGGIAGSMIGSYMDRQEREMQQLVAGREGTTVQRQQNNLSINMKSDVLFDTGSSLIKPGGNDEIARIAGVLNRYPETRVTVEGHTDSAGSESYNMQLSEQRARAVGEALVGRGVNAARVTTVGLGESRPIASNATEGGKQLNRRVTILVVPIEA